MSINTTFDADNYYFSGQGVVMMGARNPLTGLPQGLMPVGNVSELKITIATTVIDHKGAQDGQRAIDARLQTETKATASITIDNWIGQNLANALRGMSTIIPAGTSTGEAFTAGVGLVSGLQYINVNSLVVHTTAEVPVALTPYVNDLTPWDYMENDNAGSIMLNAGTGIGLVALAVAPTAVAVGATTEITIVNTAMPGDTVLLNGFAGAEASLLNGVTATVVTATGTEITVNVDTVGATITLGTATVAFLSGNMSLFNLTATYNYSAQYIIDTLTQPLTDTWLRFEGLNTLDDNSPVIVDIFKFETDPLKELALISDTFGSFVMEGALLSDSLRPVNTSKYFSVKKLIETFGG